jgi:hypothetical protein
MIMTEKDFTWRGIIKILIDLMALATFGLVGAIIGYIWQALKVGLTLGEYAFDPASFKRRYNSEDLIDALKAAQSKDKKAT